MVEEKKDEKIEKIAPEAKTEVPLVAARPEQEKKEEKPKAGLTKKEKPSNCAGCNKSIKKKRWYYRNGKYYCTKRCWKNTSKKEEKPKDAEDKK